MLCDQAIAVNGGFYEGHAIRLKCRRWSCQLCQPENRRKVIHQGRRGKPNAFLTLTVNVHRYETPDDAARDLKQAWVQLRKRIFRRYQVKNLPFLAVFERTKLGWPHLHILIRAPYLDQKWLSEQMADLIGAPIVWIEFINNEKHIQYYVTKYIGKDPHAFEGCKRYWRSHNYDLEPKEDSEYFVWVGNEWQRRDVNYMRFVMELMSSGRRFEKRGNVIHYWKPRE